jgi:phosphate transport system substrate-binding protein
LLVSAFLYVFTGCGLGNRNNTITETPTSGKTNIAIDEAYQPLFDTEIYTFEALYENAKITPLYKPEGDAFELFLKDSVRVLISSRKLTDAEDKYLRNIHFIPKTTKIAYDAVAFIINKNNQDSLILYEQIKNMFLGKINKWSQINPKSDLGNITIVFDNNKSSNTRYIKEKFELTKNFPSNCFAVKSNAEVINFVEKNKSAIGVISANWISDKHDTVSNNFLKKIKIVAIGDEGNTDGTGNYYKPYQGYIAEGTYPLLREVYMINRETFAGLGSGFISFVAGEKGQRIILKSGIVPATMPIRLVQIKH